MNRLIKVLGSGYVSEGIAELFFQVYTKRQRKEIEKA